MKFRLSNCLPIFGIGIAVLCPLGAVAQAVFDLRTTTDATGTTVTDRLFLDAGFTVKAPSTTGGTVNTGTTLWIVADTGNNGLPFALSGSGLLDSTSVLGADDQIIFNTEVDGTIIGNQAGRYQRIGVSVDSQYNSVSVPIYAYLWNPNSPGSLGKPDSTADFVEGMKFGVSQVSVSLDTIDPGNGKWNIFENVNASQWEIKPLAPVPEPEDYAIFCGMALVAFGFWRRKQAV